MLAKLWAPALDHGRRTSIARTVLAGLSALSLIALAAIDLDAQPVLAGVLIVTFLGSGFGGLFAPLLVRTPEAPPAPRALALHRAPVEGQDVVHGVVLRAPTTLSSPLGRARCVAWRLVGEGGSGEIDDAQVAPFELEIPGGQRLQVDPTGARLHVPVGAPEHVFVNEGDELGQFLSARGALRREPCRLAEGVLSVGDNVLVEGALRPALAQGGIGYRTGVAPVPVAVSVIRRIESPRAS